MARDAFPSDNSWPSAASGSDAVVLRAADFQDNQTWYVRVHAQAGADWRLFSGDLFVTDLGTLAEDTTSGGTLAVGLEGAAWFRTTVPADTLAWRLSAPGATLWISDDAAPVPTRNYKDIEADDHALIIPDYLTSGQYLVAVETTAVDSRRLPATARADP